MTYRTAAFSDDLASDVLGAARLGAEAGLDGLAIRHLDGRNVKDLDDATVRRARDVVSRHGLEISALGSPYGRGFFLDDDEAQSRAERLLARMIRFAQFLQTRNIRVFGLWIEGKDPVPRWADRPDLDLVLEQLVERLRPSVAMAERAGVRLMLELEGASYTGQVAEARRVLEAISSPALVLCWDVCNGWWSGESPLEKGRDTARGLPIVDVQTKDVEADADDPSRPRFDQVVLGDGDIPYDVLLPELVREGYDGWFTVERVYHPRKPEEHPKLQRDVLADVERLRAILASSSKEHG